MEEMRSKGMNYEGNDYIGVKFKQNAMKEAEETETESEDDD